MIGNLREIVRTDAEDFGRVRDLVRRKRAARHFDHRADEVGDLHLLLGHDFLGDAMDDFDLGDPVPS